ncbi:recombination-associated protein RdgC [Enterovibrio norvegicus]|uniref:recombination-associated protein RdgC n=1 Tax=Enterovibrio norvegicus TaxID=188144 RepID=UPI00354EFA69
MAFPKNMIIYNLTRDIGLMAADAAEKLEKLLAEFSFSPCGDMDSKKYGFIPVIGGGDLFVHAVEGNMMISALMQTKAIPSAALKKKLTAKVKEVEAREGRPLKKKEQEALKDDLMVDLMPHVLPIDKRTNGYILKGKYLVVDAPSHKAAEDFNALLRKALGSLPVSPVESNKAVELVMTEWLKSGAPQGFTLGESAELKAILDNGPVARFKNQDLTSDEVLKHLEAEKVVVKIAMNWKDRISFTIKGDLSITGMKFSEELKDQNADIDREDVAGRFDADFALAVGEITLLIAALDDCFDFYKHEAGPVGELPTVTPKTADADAIEGLVPDCCDSITITAGGNTLTISHASEETDVS